jgi:hypothetical protein
MPVESPVHVRRCHTSIHVQRYVDILLAKRKLQLRRRRCYSNGAFDSVKAVLDSVKSAGMRLNMQTRDSREEPNKTMEPTR